MMLPALVLSSLCVTAGALEVSFSSDFSTYSVTHGPQKAKLFSADAGLAVFVDGKWHSQQEKTLKMVGASKPVKGTHPALGAFTGVESSWMAGTTPMDVAAKNYVAGGTVTFEYSFPKGATGTSLVELANKTRDEVIVNFPAFTSQMLEGTMSWQGSFVGAVQGHVSKGPAGGPTVFFDPQDPKLETVVVGSGEWCPCASLWPPAWYSFSTQWFLTGHIVPLDSSGQLQIHIGRPRHGLEWQERVGTWDTRNH